MAAAWAVFREHPLLGTGYGTFASSVESFSGVDPARRLDDGNHNLVLGLAAELGLTGVLLYASIFVVLLYQLRRLRRDAADDFLVQELAALAAAMTMVFFLMSQFGDWRFHLLPHNYLFVTFGLCAAAARQLRCDSRRGSVARR
jgi:O-antigen ligase